MNDPAAAPASRVNGICVTAVFEVVDAIKAAPARAASQFRVRNVWLDGGHTRSVVKDFCAAGAAQTSRRMPLVSDTDLPGMLKGADQAPSPLEQLLIALSSCVTTTLVTQAAIRSIHVDSLQVRVLGDIDLRGFLGIDEQVPRGFGEIQLDVQLAADAAASDLDEIVSLGVRYSPVFSTVNCGTPIVVLRDGQPIPA